MSSQLRIERTDAQIGIEWQKGFLNVQIDRPELKLNYSQKRPYQTVGDLEIANPPAELKIDYTKPYEDLELRKFHSLLRFLRKKGAEKFWQGVQETARQGDYLARIEDGGDRVRQLAKEKLREDKDFTIKAIPEHPPEISITPKPIHVEIDQTKIRVDAKLAFPKIEAKGDKAKIYLAEEANLDIELVEDGIDFRV